MNLHLKRLLLALPATCVLYSLIGVLNSTSSANDQPVMNEIVTRKKIEIDSSSPEPKDLNQIEIDYWKTIDVDSMTAEEIVDYFKWSNHSACEFRHYFGGKLAVPLNPIYPTGIDGQYPVCLDNEMKPLSTNNRRCIVYSFGIKDDWSFDEALEKFGCEIFSFDPSISQADHDHKAHIHFYKIGLSNLDYVNENNWKLMSLDSIYRMLEPRHGAHVIDYLKIDVEGSEWDALKQIIESGMLSKVRQMAVEFHFPHKGDAMDSKNDSTIEGYRSMVHLVNLIEKQMIRFDSRPNIWSTGTKIGNLNNYNGPLCFEITFYQILPRNN